MITITDLEKSFGKVQAVRKLSLDVRPGTVYGLLGPNGAGKTTTVKCITSIITPDAGSITINGIDIRRQPMEAKRTIGYVPENASVFQNLSAREYLEFSGRLYRLDKVILKKRIDDILEQFGLSSSGDNLLHTYSKGMRQKVIIAAAILHNPEVLILDEPFSGLDAGSAAVLKQVVRRFAENNKTVLFSSHILEVVERLCDSISIISSGSILQSGTIKDIMAATGSSTLEDAFINLTGETDVSGEAGDILAAISGDQEG